MNSTPSFDSSPIADTARRTIAFGEFTQPIAVDLHIKHDADCHPDAFIETVPDASISAVNVRMWLSRSQDMVTFINHVARILVPGGKAVFTEYYFSNSDRLATPDMQSSFGVYTFSYVAHDPLSRRRVPQYFGDSPLTLRKVRLDFTQHTCPMNRFLTRTTNRSHHSVEGYEQRWAYLLPASTISYLVQRTEA